MSAVRQKRKSCEACRARKLKCSGKDTGCSRCVHLGLVCKFHDKGLPGRPRKWSLVEHGEQNHLRPSRQDPKQNGSQDAAQDAHLGNQGSQYQRDPDLQHSHHTPPATFTDASSVAAAGTADLLSVAAPDWTARDGDDMVFGYDQSGALPFLDFNTSAQLDSLPLDSCRVCMSHSTNTGDPSDMSPNESVASAIPQQSCDCAKQVFDMIRSLQHDPVSHSMLGNLRRGIRLFEKLLTCPICYDVSKPPRLTLQNVLLLGRLVLAVAAGYHQYAEWLKNHYGDSAGEKMNDVVYLLTGDSVTENLAFSISSDKLYDLVVHGLRDDAQKLSELGQRFAIRQHNRHLIGHEACPDSEGHCWKEKEGMDPDPSDVCPQSAAARALTPCYRVVDEVRSKVKQFGDILT